MNGLSSILIGVAIALLPVAAAGAVVWTRAFRIIDWRWYDRAIRRDATAVQRSLQNKNS